MKNSFCSIVHIVVHDLHAFVFYMQEFTLETNLQAQTAEVQPDGLRRGLPAAAGSRPAGDGPRRRGVLAGARHWPARALG